LPTSGQTILAALEIDDAVTVERVICEGLNPNSTVKWPGEKSLHIAALNDAFESAEVSIKLHMFYSRWCCFLQVLLRYGVAVDGSDSEALFSFYFLGPLGTPLHNAAGTGSVRVLEVRLHCLVLKEFFVPCKLLIENGANVNSKSSILGITPLMRTAYAGTVQAMKVMDKL